MAKMWQIKHNLSVDFVIPVKKNMDIWHDVVGLRNEYTRIRSSHGNMAKRVCPGDIWLRVVSAIPNIQRLVIRMM